MNKVFLEEKTTWFRRQLVKYYLLGFIMILLVLVSKLNSNWHIEFIDTTYFFMFKKILARKAIYALSIFGVAIFLFKYFRPNMKFTKLMELDRGRLKQLGISLLCISSFTLFATHINKSFALMWPFALFSLVPIELIFQSISRLRSKRNVIFVAYILVCILDSHLEGRIIMEYKHGM